MKKLTFVLALIMVLSLSASTVFAGPGDGQGPYGPTLAVDGCDGTPDAIETPCDSGTNFDVYRAINHVFDELGVVPSFGTLTSNEETDAFNVPGPNSYWNSLAGAGDASDFAFIAITAGANNKFGVYPEGDPGSVTFFDPSHTGNKFLGKGTAGDPYPGAINPISGQGLGFALQSEVGGSTTNYYSDELLNSDGKDHMIAYHLKDLAGETVFVRVDSDNDGDLDGDDDVVEITFTQDTYYLAWEDLPLDGTSDEDYNDFGVLVTKIAPVPEPMSLMLVGTGLAAMARTRKRKRS